ncbi:MAG: trypsin-like peptidase domain-containing protein [Verrucomicrobiae bacterium]|nr:trypsin-like peptidase domain-containing protein [Verrucomicrobiae bacterium]
MSISRPGVPSLAALALPFLLLAGVPTHAAEPDPDLDLARRLNAAFVRVAETVSPAVVVINVQSKRSASSNLEGDGLFRFLPEELRERLEQERRRRPPEEDQGSGVILRDDGFILTNGHVVQDAERIQVRLRDGRRFPAEVRGIDSESDLAVIKVEAANLPVARLGRSSEVRVGEFAIAIGAPFGHDYSVTFGHVSAKGRRVAADMVMMDQDFIQTDASINPGNSGGPLVNIEGQVIGINSMIRGLNTGIGFAVPIDLAREVAERLIETGRFTRSWLGISIANLRTAPESRPPDVPVEDGVVVLDILRQGPSWGSDLEAQDVIVSIEGEPVRNDVELKRQVSRRPPGQPIRVEVYRGDRKLPLTVTPGELPSDRLTVARRPAPASPRAPEPVAAFGITVLQLDASNADRVGLAPGEGVLVVSVDADSPAARRRIREGEVITKINRRPVRSLSEFAEAVRDADLTRGVSVTLVNEIGRRFEILRSTGD